MSVRPGSAAALALLCLAAASAPLSAAIRTWPAPGPCATGTLQACIDGAIAGDTVRIDAEEPVDETVEIVRSLTLEPAPGARPAFAPGRSVLADGADAEFNLTVRGLALSAGRIEVRVLPGLPGNSRVVIEDNVLHAGSAPTQSYIAIEAGSRATLDYRIRNNRVGHAGGRVQAGIGVAARGPSEGRIDFNEVRTGDSLGAGIRFDGEVGVDFASFVHNNRVHGNFDEGGIAAELAGSVAVEADVRSLRVLNNQVSCAWREGVFPRGLRVVPGQGRMHLLAVNNTLVNCRDGIHIIDTESAGGTQRVDGALRNNLVAFNSGNGIFVNPAHFDTVEADTNLVYGNGSNQFPTSNVNLVTANPKLRSMRSPWPLPGSPAINAGDAPFAQLAFALAGAPQLDANGLRRTNGLGASAIDIGAFETGDSVFARRVRATGGETHIFGLRDRSSDGNAAVRPLVSKVFNVGGVSGTSNPAPIGAWYEGAFWTAYNQDFADMLPGMGFHTFVPSPSGSFGTSKLHVATAATVTDHYTRVGDDFLDDTADAFVLATSNYGIGATTHYNTELFAVGYACIGPPEAGCWVIMNLDGSAMSTQASFNVYAQPPSPNAFVHAATSENSSPSTTYLDHPLLNGTPCAAPVVSEKLTSIGAHPVQLIYAGGADGQWSIAAQDGASLVGREYYVLVDPKQVDECLRGLFSDGFE